MSTKFAPRGFGSLVTNLKFQEHLEVSFKAVGHKMAAEIEGFNADKRLLLLSKIALQISQRLTI